MSALLFFVYFVCFVVRNTRHAAGLADTIRVPFTILTHLARRSRQADSGASGEELAASLFDLLAAAHRGPSCCSLEFSLSLSWFLFWHLLDVTREPGPGILYRETTLRPQSP